MMRVVERPRRTGSGNVWGILGQLGVLLGRLGSVKNGCGNEFSG